VYPIRPPNIHTRLSLSPKPIASRAATLIRPSAARADLIEIPRSAIDNIRGACLEAFWTNLQATFQRPKRSGYGGEKRWCVARRSFDMRRSLQWMNMFGGKPSEPLRSHRIAGIGPDVVTQNHPDLPVSLLFHRAKVLTAVEVALVLPADLDLEEVHSRGSNAPLRRSCQRCEASTDEVGKGGQALGVGEGGDLAASAPWSLMENVPGARRVKPAAPDTFRTLLNGG
jgi:hypothetical protein